LKSCAGSCKVIAFCNLCGGGRGGVCSSSIVVLLVIALSWRCLDQAALYRILDFLGEKDVAAWYDLLLQNSR